MKTWRLFAVIALLCAFGMSPTAQEDVGEQSSTPVKPLELYKTLGRAWVHEITKWERGQPARRGTSTSRVESIDGDNSMCRTSVRWEPVPAQGGISEEGSGGVMRVALDQKLSGEWEAWADAALPEETVDVGFAKFVSRKHVEMKDGIQTTTWVSTEYHPLIVKQVKLGKDSCETWTLKSFDAGGTDPYALFRVAGRSFTFRHSEGTARIVVKAFTNSTVTLELTTFDEHGEITHGPEVDTHEYADLRQMGQPETVAFIEEDGDVSVKRTPWPVVGEETIKVDAGEFECTVYADPDSDVKVWASKHFAPLLIKDQREMASSELIELDLGHDQHRLNRKAGNYSLTRATTSMGAVNAETSLRMEVSSVENGVAKVVMTHLDGAGNEQFSTELDMKVPELKSPLMPYTGQVEESITTPAGTFRCIKTEAEGSTIWTYHGVIVRMVLEQDNFKVKQELVELKLD